MENLIATLLVIGFIAFCYKTSKTFFKKTETNS